MSRASLFYPFDSTPRKVRSPTVPRSEIRQISRSTFTRMKLAPAPRCCYGLVTPRLRHHRKLRNLTSRRSVRLVSKLRCSMTTLISFDVDGTLIHSVGEGANKLHKLAFSHAFKSVFGIDTDIDVVKHHGSTDPLILVAVLMHHGVSKEEAMGKLPELQAAMNAYFEAHVSEASTGLEVLPGVVPMLKALQSRGDVLTCLVTGNLEPIGWAKMRALGLYDLFSAPGFGGFGSDTCSGNTSESWKDRAELVRIAASRAQQHSSDPIRRRYHIGDTPMDLQAAEGGGAQGVGVITGIFTRDQLAAVSPDAPILDNVQDLDAVMASFGLL